jgi:hypothetical protein
MCIFINLEWHIIRTGFPTWLTFSLLKHKLQLGNVKTARCAKQHTERKWLCFTEGIKIKCLLRQSLNLIQSCTFGVDNNESNFFLLIIYSYRIGLILSFFLYFRLYSKRSPMSYPTSLPLSLSML